MKYLVLVILLFIVNSARTQVSDSFTDGDFDNVPQWGGNVHAFSVNSNFQLQLDTTGADSKLLFTKNVRINETEWCFWLKLNFDPSANNSVKIYLASDKANLNGNLNGYFIKIGENGSQDGIDLYRQNGFSSTLLINGMDRHAASKPSLRIKVIHKSSGDWFLYSDTTGQFNFTPEGNCFDHSIDSSLYFGITCKFTSTYSKQFFFDDFYAGPILIDSIPPKINSVEIINGHQIKLSFNETVDPGDAGNLTHYLVNQNFGIPDQIQLLNQNSLILVFKDSFKANFLYCITISSIHDMEGNQLAADSLEFYKYLPSAKDVVINEIMADPSPAVNLPDHEFIELLNTTTYPFPLDPGYLKLDIGGHAVTLPHEKIYAGAYVILCSSEDSSAFLPYGKVLGLPSLPSINNSGTTITLKSPDHILIDSLHFDLSWYQDDLKSNGGWTLERIHPYDPCNNESNWSSSKDPNGGSPGKINSIFSNVPDTVYPLLLQIKVIDSLDIELTFNEPLDSSSLKMENFRTSCNIPVKMFKKISPKCLSLHLSFPMNNSDTCSLEVNHLMDCTGNRMEKWRSYPFRYIKTGIANENDIIITELYPDPDPSHGLPESEFIELFNRSSKYISLNGWSVSDKYTTAFLNDCIVYPDSFVILCPVNAVSAFSKFGNALGLTVFPSLNHTGDLIQLKNEKGAVIYFVNYDISWYKDEFKKDGGWSLEMIDTSQYCSGQENWMASAAPSGGTPGTVNSVNGSTPDLVPPVVSKVGNYSSHNILVLFSKRMDTTSILSTTNYQLEEPLMSVLNITINKPFDNLVNLLINDSLSFKTIYTIKFRNLKDCSGNSLNGDQKFQFGRAENADSGDVFINEILFNPLPGGHDFVELYNCSDKVIAVNSMIIASLNEDNTLKDMKSLTDSVFQQFPGDYVVFTEDPSDIIIKYKFVNSLKLSGLLSLPAFNNDKGHIKILNHKNKILDDFSYTDKMHFPLLTSTQGVSLERISMQGKTNNPSNWHSASSQSGYATPTRQNSQYEILSNDKNTFSLSTEIFSPDNDGYQDNLILSYKFDTSGYYGSIYIFSVEGRIIRTLINNQLFGTEGFYLWDGTDDRGSKVVVGVYILLVKLTHANGFTKKYKFTCTVAR